MEFMVTYENFFFENLWYGITYGNVKVNITFLSLP